MTFSSLSSFSMVAMTSQNLCRKFLESPPGMKAPENKAPELKENSGQKKFPREIFHHVGVALRSLVFAHEQELKRTFLVRIIKN